MSTPVSSSSSLSSTSPSNSASVLNTLLGNSSGSQGASGQPSISFGGLVSGLNTQAIIQAMLAADRQPILLLQAQQASEQAKLQAWQDLNTQIQTLQAAASTLGLASTTAAKQLTFSGPSGTFATGTASSAAVNGSFNLQIDQIATASKVSSTGGIGVAINGNDVVTSTSKTGTPITNGSFSVDGHAVTITTGETFNVLLADISTQTGGAVTAAISGNGIQLTSTNGQPIVLGSGSDTSNFLSVTRLAAQPAALTMTSAGPVGVANASAVLDSANINGLQSNANGSLVINGVSINYNTVTDSLNTVLQRINASAAGVIANYDPNSDTVSFTSTKSGNVDVSVADGAGNLLSSLNVLSPSAHQLGLSAKYEVNGGPAQYSLTNSITGIVPGVNVTLQATTPTGAGTTPLVGNVALDSSVGSKAIQDFVTAYNAVVNTITTDTAYNATTKQAGLFLGDSTIESIQSQLDSTLFIANGSSLGLPSGFTDVSAIGLTTGAIGSAPGTTTTLQFDATKFQAAMSQNPAAVNQLVTKVFSSFSQMALNVTKPFGVIDSAIQSETTQIINFQHDIDNQNQLLQMQSNALNQEFTQLEQTLAQIQSQASSSGTALSSLSPSGSSSSSSTSSLA